MKSTDSAIDPRIASFPLSAVQRGIWFDLLNDPESNVYGLYIRLVSRRPFDIGKLEETAVIIQDTHPQLTMTLSGDGLPPDQTVSPGRVLDIHLFPYSWRDEEDRERAIDRYRREPFALSGEPLFRVSFWDRADGGQDMILSYHHLAADAWSMGIILEDFLSFYYRGEIPEKPGNSYRDYVEWSEARVSGDDGKADLDYWRGELAGAEPLHCLPVSGERGAVKRLEGGTVPFPLPDSVSGWKGYTPYEVFLSAYLVLLSVYADRRDVSVLVPLLGRPRGGYRRVVGDFVNVGVIRVQVDGGAPFTDLLETVHRKLRGAVVHQFCPFPVLVRELGLNPAPGHAPVSDAYCGMVFIPPGLPMGSGDGDPEFTLHSTEQTGAPWDVAVELYEHGNHRSGVIRYRKDLWEEGDISAMAARFTEILERAAAHPEDRLDHLGWLGGEERTVLDERRRRAGLRIEERPFAPSSTETERDIAAIWSAVLEREHIGMDDDFFILGGNSLRATRVISRMSRRFRTDLPLDILFRVRTIRGLAAYVDEQGPVLAPVPITRIPVPADASPLSFSQERMWFLDQLEPESIAYTIQACLRVRGRIDTEELDSAFVRLQLRHETLRTTFHLRGGVPIQVVHPEGSARLEVIDLPGDVPDSNFSLAVLRAEEAVARHFDLETGPVVRLEILRISGDDMVAVFTLHHIAGDLWSLEVFGRELFALYGNGSGREDGLEPLPIRYCDYAAWQRKVMTPESLAPQRDYWVRRLSGVKPLELPYDVARRTGYANRGGVVRIALSRADIDGIRRFGRLHGVTPYMLLLSCFAVFLSRWTGADDIPVGTPVANRTQPEVEGLIGTFVNTLVLRIGVNRDSAFTALLRDVQTLAAEAFRHQDYPFEWLVEALNPARDLDHPPLVQVLFTMAELRLWEDLQGDFTVEPVPLETVGAQFDLSMGAELDFSREIVLVYNRDLFTGASARRMLDAYVRIFRHVLANPYTAVGDIPVLTPDERHQIVSGWNDTARDYPLAQPLWRHLRAAAESRAGDIALVAGGESLTYAGLFERAERCARFLSAEGIGAGSVVGVFLPRNADLVAALLGVMASGAAYLPLDPSYPPARLAYMIAKAGTAAVISCPETAGGVDFGRVPSYDIGALLNAETVSGTPLPPAAGPGDTAYILFTSGSTGEPKGVAVPNGALVNFLFSMRESPGYACTDGLLAVTPVSFDISGLELFLPLLSGGTLFLASAETAADPVLLKGALADQRITVMQATPATWRMLVEAGWRGRLGKILCGGEAFPEDLVGPLLERCGELWNLYGPTETTIWSAIHRVFGSEGPVPIGRPIANTAVYVLDSRMEPVPAGVHGDIYIGGAGLASGYVGRKDLTDAAFVPHPWEPGEKIYSTGDRGRFLEDGTIQCLGRTDGQVKLHGFRIELGEIEAALAAHPAVRQAACAVIDAGRGDSRLAAYIVPRQSVPSDAELREFLASLLPSYMVPGVFAVLERLPLTPNGKIDRRALPLPESRTAGTDHVPRNEDEKRIMEIWREVLGLEEMGVEDDFFAVGGHSLSAARLVGRIMDAYGVKVPLRAFFLDPTVRGAARLVRGAGSRAVPDRVETETLFTMQPYGEQRPVFLVAGIHSEEDGMYLYLSRMIHNLGRDIPVYGLRPRGLKGDSPLFGSIGEMAEEYIVQIRAVQPEGPYRLVGECIGGLVAYEMALRMAGLGEEVERLLLLDTEYPHPFRNKFLFAYRRISRKISRMAWLLISLLTTPRVMMNEIRSYLGRKRARLFPRTEDERRLRRFQDIKRRYLKLTRRYSVQNYPGTVHLLVNEIDFRRYPSLGWPVRPGSKRGPAAVVSDLVKGDHTTRLTIFGPGTGEAIRKVLDGTGSRDQ